ncbi:MAG: hypothetical protein Kow0059_05440 [Candidatus Sumerlaeia bacterium]
MNTYLDLAKELQAMAQAGLTYATDPFDRERYERLGVLARSLMARLADVPIARIENFFVPETGYPTPKVDLRAGVFDRRGRVLLVKERKTSRWALPGGWADVNEPPSLGVEREAREEAGVAVRAVRLVAVRDRDRHPYVPKYPVHIYKLFFLCELLKGEGCDGAGDGAGAPEGEAHTAGGHGARIGAANGANSTPSAGIQHVHEIMAADWFDPAALPPLSVDKTLAADVALLAAARSDPAMPVYFD